MTTLGKAEWKNVQEIEQMEKDREGIPGKEVKARF